mmetsp:Transcript_23864/g.3979  ORF Transcript_23864/g.3979 Transcript_23864/m.3979 type:complete len:109 (+) Transcript_23864:2-328(+)
MTTFSNLSIDVFHELTRVRTHPSSFADDMEKYLEQYKANNAFHRPNAVPLITREGRDACVEALNFLREQSPIESLNYSEGLSRAAQFLVNDTGSKGIIGHIASDESRF